MKIDLNDLLCHRQSIWFPENKSLVRLLFGEANEHSAAFVVNGFFR
jgi:hypothetical protein